MYYINKYKKKCLLISCLILYTLFLLFCSQNGEDYKILLNENKIAYFKLELINNATDTDSKDIINNFENKIYNSIYVYNENLKKLNNIEELKEYFQNKENNIKNNKTEKARYILPVDTDFFIKNDFRPNQLYKIKLIFNKADNENQANFNLTVLELTNEGWEEIANAGNFQLPYNYKNNSDKEKKESVEKMINIVTIISFKYSLPVEKKNNSNGIY